ncbi:MAG: site-specific DNA-methyltransferase [Candidatus Thorarchaeota archaeon]|jgi:site-specific DNA-methyltransferase (adenine-specific)
MARIFKKANVDSFVSPQMTLGTDDDSKEKTKQESRRYIPNLAEFYFKPLYDWSPDDAKKLYNSQKDSISNIELNRVQFIDCIEGMKKIPDSCVDLVIADPPFGIDFDGKSGVYNRDENLVVEGYGEVEDSYDDFTFAWMSRLPRIMTDEASAYVFSGWNNLEAVLRSARKAGFTTINHIIWRYQFGVYTKRRFVTSHYHILFLVKDPDQYFFNKIEHYPQDVWRIKRSYRTGLKKNSTKLPIEVVRRCIDFSSKPGDIVLDPFMGNGTTAVASKANWRHFLGFEVNKELRKIIESDIEAVIPGESYTPYEDRIPSIEELAKRYPRAYQEYLKEMGSK